MTSAALVFVTALVLLIFSVLDVKLLSKFSVVQLISAFVLLLVFVEVVLVVLSTHLFVQTPLQKLTQVMRLAESGQFLARSEISHLEDEIGDISRNFNQMMAHITDLDARKIETERELIVAQQELKFQTELEEKARIIEDTNRKLEKSIKDFESLYRIAESLNRTLELPELFTMVTRALSETSAFKEFALLFFDEKRTSLEVRAAYGFKDNSRLMGMKFWEGEGLSWLAAADKKTIYVPDTAKEPRYLRFKGEKLENGSFVSLPLIVVDHVVGVLNVENPQIGAFGPADIQFMESIATHIAMAYHRAVLYMKTKELSVRDELTGLYNRRHFQEAIRMEWKRALRFSRPLSLLMVDVDFFKQFNDRFGHVRGDVALKQLAGLLVKNLREVDTVARFGGEEFVVMLPDTRYPDALLVAEKIRTLFESTPVMLEATSSEVLTVSIGVSAFPEKCGTEDNLIATADEALYRAKALGRNQVVGYEPPVGTATDSKGNVSPIRHHRFAS